VTPTEVFLTAWLAFCPHQRTTIHDPFGGTLYHCRLAQNQPDAFWPTTQYIEIQRLDENGFDSQVFSYSRNNFQPLQRPVRRVDHYDRNGDLK
jgi:hypothetical protein